MQEMLLVLLNTMEKECSMILTYYCFVYPKHQRRQDSNGSSSDDGTRSSGHASMSDGHLSSSPPAERHQHYQSHLNSVPEDERYTAVFSSNHGMYS